MNITYTVSQKKRRSCAFNVLWRIGIVQGRFSSVDNLNIKRLNSISDEELLQQRGCGPVILDAIQNFRKNINNAISQPL